MKWQYPYLTQNPDVCMYVDRLGGLNSWLRSPVEYSIHIPALSSKLFQLFLPMPVRWAELPGLLLGVTSLR